MISISIKSERRVQGISKEGNGLKEKATLKMSWLCSGQSKDDSYKEQVRKIRKGLEC